MRGLFIDADDDLAAVFARVVRPGDAVDLHLQQHVAPEELPSLLAGYGFALTDRTAMPTEWVARCAGLKHIVFLGTGASSYMDVAALAAAGVTVHTVKGYGDRAVAEHAMALAFDAARGLAAMDRGVRAGGWPRAQGLQLGGKTLGLLGYGGVAAALGQIAAGVGMKVIAWNRTPRPAEPHVTFVDLDTLLADSRVLSVHLALTDETRGFLSADRLARLPRGALLVNTSRGGCIDEAALVEALRSGQVGRAGGLRV